MHVIASTVAYQTNNKTTNMQSTAGNNYKYYLCDYNIKYYDYVCDYTP